MIEDEGASQEGMYSVVDVSGRNHGTGTPPLTRFFGTR